MGREPGAGVGGGARTPHATRPNSDAGTPDAVGTVFSALADPTRRHVVETLARQRTGTPTSLAAELPITRQALSKHLRALSEAGLVISSRAGRETRYELTPRALGDATEWLVRVGAEWDERLGGLERALRERPR